MSWVDSLVVGVSDLLEGGTSLFYSERDQVQDDSPLPNYKPVQEDAPLEEITTRLEKVLSDFQTSQRDEIRKLHLLKESGDTAHTEELLSLYNARVAALEAELVNMQRRQTHLDALYQDKEAMYQEQINTLKAAKGSEVDVLHKERHEMVERHQRELKAYKKEGGSRGEETWKQQLDEERARNLEETRKLKEETTKIMEDRNKLQADMEKVHAQTQGQIAQVKERASAEMVKMKAEMDNVLAQASNSRVSLEAQAREDRELLERELEAQSSKFREEIDALTSELLNISTMSVPEKDDYGHEEAHKHVHFQLEQSEVARLHSGLQVTSLEEILVKKEKEISELRRNLATTLLELREERQEVSNEFQAEEERIVELEFRLEEKEKSLFARTEHMAEMQIELDSAQSACVQLKALNTSLKRRVEEEKQCRRVLEEEKEKRLAEADATSRNQELEGEKGRSKVRELEEEVMSKSNEVEALKERLEDLEEQVQVSKMQVGGVNQVVAQLEGVQGELSGLQEEIKGMNALKDELSELKEELKDVDELKEELQGMDRLKEENSRLRQQITQLDTLKSEVQYVETLEEVLQLESLKQENQSLKQELTHLETLREEFTHMETLQEELSQLEKTHNQEQERLLKKEQRKHQEQVQKLTLAHDEAAHMHSKTVEELVKQKEALKGEVRSLNETLSYLSSPVKAAKPHSSAVKAMQSPQKLQERAHRIEKQTKKMQRE